MMKNKFNVIIENNGVFEKYDILPYLERRWEEYPPKKDKDIQDWVKDNLMCQYWSRCQYEMVLSPWVGRGKAQKVDIYWQCLMNLELITRLFKENVGKI